MGIFDKTREVVDRAKAAAVVAKVNYDLGQAGFKPEDYAGFDSERSGDKEADGEQS